MKKALLALALVVTIFALLYWWFIPWRPVLKPFKVDGLKESNLSSDFLNQEKIKVLAVTSHIDDIEFFCGGTLARLQKQKAKTIVIVGTENYKWYYTTSSLSRKNTKIRKKEQEKVAKYFGYQKVIYLGYPDFRLKAEKNSVEKVRKIMEEFEPDVILTFDVITPPSIQHRDHLEAGKIALLAAKESRSKAKILMFASRKPNFYVDVTSTINRKWEVLRMFNSEFKKESHVFEMLKSWAQQAGKKAGTSYAEAYHVVEISH